MDQSDETPTPSSKAWYESKLFWLGILMTLSGIVPLAIELTRSGTINPEGVITFLGGVITVILRVWFTDTPTTRPF